MAKDPETRLGDLEVGYEDLAANQERIIDLLIGPPVVAGELTLKDLNGNVLRDTEKGMNYRVDYVYDKLSNGNGLRIQLPKGAWIAIVVALIGLIGNLLAAIVG